MTALFHASRSSQEANEYSCCRCVSSKMDFSIKDQDAWESFAWESSLLRSDPFDPLRFEVWDSSFGSQGAS